MNKYIVIPDITDQSTHHVVQMPRNFYIKTKACADGVAVLIGDKDADFIYGITVSCDEEYFPVLRKAITMGKAEDIEQQVLNKFEAIILDFLENEEAILELRFRTGYLHVELNDILLAARKASHKRFDLEKDKKQKNTQKQITT